MSQIVEYEVLVGAKYQQYVFKLRALCGFLNGPEGTDFKKLRDFLRRNTIWDKERTSKALALFDITWDRKKVTLGNAIKRLIATSSDEDFKDELFKRLQLSNILLVKYVLEALDVDSGGRLHSVHELYRMVTSYVYPGEYITLTNFQAWIEWMAASEVIRLVGIRWALSETRGQAAVEELKAMDVEEILEDLEEEAESGGSEDGDDDDDWGVPDSTEADPPAAATADANEEDEFADWADMPPEPSAPSPAQIAAAEANFTEQFPEEGALPDPGMPETAQPAPSTPQVQASMAPQAGLHPPLAYTTSVIPPSVLQFDLEATALAERIIRWWNELGDWPCYTGPDLGVSVPKADSGETLNEQALLTELATLGLVIEGLPAQPQVFGFVTRLREAGVFAMLCSDAALEDWLDAAGTYEDAPWARPLMGRLIHVNPIRKRIQAKPDILERVRASKTGAEAVLVLRDEIFGETWVEAPFWTLRELVRLSVVSGEACESVAVVPTRRLLDNATRIGLIPRKDIASFEELIRAAEAVASLFGPRAGYGEALEVMDRALRLGA